MKKVYTGIDIGSHSIKIVVNEVIHHKFHVLAATSVPTKGVKRGLIQDPDVVVSSLKKAREEIEGMLGVSIDQAIVAIPSFDLHLTIVEGKVDLQDDPITSEDINRALQDATLGRLEEQRELVTLIPIAFHVDDKEGVKDPRGLSGDTLAVKAVMATVPKEILTIPFSILRQVGIEPIDIAFSETGDYYEARNKNIDSKIGAIINIGYETIKVSVFNKGIMIKSSTLNGGSKQVDHDIQYMYHVSKKNARFLKENFAVSNTSYADVNDIIEVEDKEGKIISLNQLELSSVVEARIVEILKLAKKEISLLTNREISYIIVTGGISELAGFQYVLDNVLGRLAITLNITSMGIRNNKYSSAAGLTRYFDEKLSLRGRNYSMLSERKSVELGTVKRKESNGSMVGKVFGYLFDHKEN